MLLVPKKVPSRGYKRSREGHVPSLRWKGRKDAKNSVVVRCVLCVESIRPLSRVSCPPFYRPRGEQGIHTGERGENQRWSGSFEGAGSSFSLEPALLTWQTTPGVACLAEPERAGLWLCFREWSRPILPRRTVRCVRVSSHDSVGSRWGSDYTSITVDDVSSFLNYSGCRMLMSGSTSEG